MQAINPYLAFESLDDLIREGLLPNLKHDYAVQKYIKAVTKGVIKVMSKIGISTIQSYRGAQIFEALGINHTVIDKYFTATASRIGGIDLNIIAKEALMRHQLAYDHHDAEQRSLKAGNVFQWRNEEEEHQYNPATIFALQKAVKLGDYKLYKQYSKLMHEDAEVKFNLRNLLDFNYAEQPLSLSEVRIGAKHREAFQIWCDVIRFHQPRSARSLGDCDEPFGRTL